MPMRQIRIKGGYGEHGRSCFMVPYRDGHFYMVDCGIMDTDPFPFPAITRQEAEQTDLLFLTHLHKDHTGALQHLISKGFHGTVIASADTFRLTGFQTGNSAVIPGNGIEETAVGEKLKVRSGRSGHCPGSLWYLISSEDGVRFFSGDYQRDPLVYCLDEAKGIQADTAILDMAHAEQKDSPDDLRNRIAETVCHALHQKRPVLFPVPRYGRGTEILYLLCDRFETDKIWCDPLFLISMAKMLENNTWCTAEMHEKLCRITACLERTKREDAEILITADPHLELKKNQRIAREVLDRGGLILITGRKKEGTPAADLLESGKARHLLYPHHCSRTDTETLCRENRFSLVLPFHTEIREVWYPDL